MCTIEEKTRAVELYVKYGRKAAAAIRELGYPSRAQLAASALARFLVKVSIPPMCGGY